MTEFLARMNELFYLGAMVIRAAFIWVAVRVLGVFLWVLGGVLLTVFSPVILIGKVADMLGWRANVRGDLIR